MSIHEALQPLDFAVIILYIISVLALGFWVSFKKDHTEDLFLAGRRLGWTNVGLSIFGTNVSPSMMIGSCGVAYATGMVASNFEWLAWIMLLVLAMLFLPHYLNTKISTMPEFIDKRFGGKARDVLAYYSIFATLVMWLGGNTYAGAVLLGQIMNWPVWVSLVFLMVIGTSFTIAGGLAAVVITDSFQSILMILASAALTIIGLVHLGSFENLYTGVPQDFWLLFRPADDAAYPWHAILLGYPIIGIWFWCSDQTIVQRVLGARNIRQAQLGTIFAGFLKIVTPLIFFVPGIICRVSFPDLSDPDTAYMTMVTQYMPVGMVGLIVAVLIAAIVSTVDSGLNSLSTVFTLDIYLKRIRPNADTKEKIFVGRIVTLAAAVVSVLLALAISAVEGMDLFSLMASIIGFLAPPLAAVFLLGVTWKRATSQAALVTLIFGTVLSVGVGILYLAKFPSEDFYPHFLLLSFYITVVLMAIMLIVSIFTPAPKPEHRLSSIKQAYKNMDNYSPKAIWIWWAALGVIMFGIYIGFQYLGT